jgi:hypothetical protein
MEYSWNDTGREINKTTPIKARPSATLSTNITSSTLNYFIVYHFYRISVQ